MTNPDKAALGCITVVVGLGPLMLGLVLAGTAVCGLLQGSVGVFFGCGFFAAVCFAFTWLATRHLFGK